MKRTRLKDHLDIPSSRLNPADKGPGGSATERVLACQPRAVGQQHPGRAGPESHIAFLDRSCAEAWQQSVEDRLLVRFYKGLDPVPCFLSANAWLLGIAVIDG